MSSMNEALLQLLAGGSTDLNSTTVNDRLTQLAQSDPRLAPLISQLQQRLSAANQVIDVTPEEQEDTPVEESSLHKRCEKLERIARRIFGELKVMRTRNDMLATALGACQLCWGEDPACPYCHGSGTVGAYIINRKMFEQVVGPALEQLRQIEPELTKKEESRSRACH